MIVHHLPRTSALTRSLSGGDSQWGLTEHLIAILVDAVQIGNWQRSNQGRKSPLPKPKPLPRPGTEGAGEKKFGSDPIPIKDFDAWWSGAA